LHELAKDGVAHLIAEVWQANVPTYNDIPACPEEGVISLKQSFLQLRKTRIGGAHAVRLLNDRLAGRSTVDSTGQMDHQSSQTITTFCIVTFSQQGS